MPQNTETCDRLAIRLFLIGYRGSGKSTVGHGLAERLGWPQYDTDQLVVQKHGLNISSIFQQHGEATFRDWETEAIEHVCQQPAPLIASLGGGAPTIERNVQLMQRAGKVVWLSASAEELWRRISADEQTTQQRPDLTSTGGQQEVESVLEWRTPIYRQAAELEVNVQQRSISEIVGQIVNWLAQSATPR